jgi:hypothetical protein
MGNRSGAPGGLARGAASYREASDLDFGALEEIC